MKKTRYSLLVSFALASAGCTTALRTQYVAVSQKPVTGVIYTLPMAAFDVEAQLLVLSCTVVSGVAVLNYELVDGSIRNIYVTDPAETYVLDYSLLNSALKTTTVSATLYPNGMLKAINADVEDRTAQVVSSLGTTVLNLYRASTLAFVPTAAAPPANRCGAFIDAKTDKRRDLLEREIPAAKADDAALAEDVVRADELAAQLEAANTKLSDAQKAKDDNAIASANTTIAQVRPKLTVAKRKLSGRVPKLAALKAQADVLSSALTIKLRKQAWAPSGAAAEVCTKVTSKQSEFFDKLVSAVSATPAYALAPGAEFSVDVCAVPQPNSRRALAPSDDAYRYSGVVYRMPATGTIFIRNSIRSSERIEATAAVSLPQFGAKGLVWLENKAFDKNNVKVSFNEDGSMSEITFSALARAERAAAAATDTSNTIVELMKLRAEAVKVRAEAGTAEEKKVQQKQLDTIDDQIALLKKQRELDAARLPAKDAYDTRKEQLQKEIDVETLQQELDTLKKKTGPT